MAHPLRGLTCWLLDTRDLWPGDRIEEAVGIRCPFPPSSATPCPTLGSLHLKASDLLSLLPPDEQTVIKAKYFLHDAKLHLASALLKRTFVSRCLAIPWTEVRYVRLGDPKHGKPAAVDDDGRRAAGLDFNISHQASLVALIGYYDADRHRSGPSAGVSVGVSVGVDVVCVNERDDWARVDAAGWESFVDTYDAVFSDAELWDMKFNVDAVTLPSGRVLAGGAIGRADRCVTRHAALDVELDGGERLRLEGDAVLEAKLRRFYAFFAYKEAFVKSSGEALLADWLRDCEFHNVKSPRPARVWGQKLEDAHVSVGGKAVGHVRLGIQAFREHVMIATAVGGLDAAVPVPEFRLLDLESDVLVYIRQ